MTQHVWAHTAGTFFPGDIQLCRAQSTQRRPQDLMGFEEEYHLSGLLLQFQDHQGMPNTYVLLMPRKSNASLSANTQPSIITLLRCQLPTTSFLTFH
mmetsp:Transcript_17559/g.31171  ORF Transcript_17559/g.31171 Transcript_17559/m.31171 type:complete len:97 (-) Transcript_17559:399-689(-)